MEAQTFQRFLKLCVPGAILAIIAFAYLPGIFILSYTADDYIFLAQTMEHGLAKSILIPFADHFIPVYRLLLGGSHLLFASAIPIRILSLGFHLLSTYLVFRIVRRHTKSTLLSAVSSVTFGFSVWDATDILRCVNGHWPMSLFFILLMAIFFDKFFDANKDRARPRSDTPDSAGTVPVPTKEQASAAQADLKYYYAGLVSFAIGLGTFTNALFGGTILWLFAYARILLTKGSRRNLRDHLKILLPFAVIVAAYLLLRRYFISKYFSLQGILFHLIKASDSLTFQEKVAAIAELPAEFFLDVLRQLSPYFPAHGFLFLALLALLWGKEFVVRRREVYAPTAWLTFALAVFFVLSIRDMMLYVTLPGPIDPAMPSRYLYYSMAGTSIALGLLLRPPPSWEDAVAKVSNRVRTLLLVVAAVSLCALNFDKFTDIREQSHRFERKNRRFYQVVTQYRESMQAFLESSVYFTDREYYFLLRPAVDAREYPAGYAVMQSDIFHMYFPAVKNVHFLSPEEQKKDVYLWSPSAITPP